MHPFKSYWGETISLTCILPQQQKLRQNFVDDYQYRTGPVYYNDISFWKLQIYSMHPCKSFTDRKPIPTQEQKLSRKRAITVPKFCGWLQISNDLYFIMIYPSANFQCNQCISAKQVHLKAYFHLHFLWYSQGRTYVFILSLSANSENLIRIEVRADFN